MDTSYCNIYLMDLKILLVYVWDIQEVTSLQIILRLL